jgi:hypothetical protein
MLRLDQFVINILKNKKAGTFAEFKEGNLTIGVMTAGNELEIHGVWRLDVVCEVNGKTGFLFEQTDGTVVEIPPTYDMITFQLQPVPEGK